VGSDDKHLPSTLKRAFLSLEKSTFSFLKRGGPEAQTTTARYDLAMRTALVDYELGVRDEFAVRLPQISIGAIWSSLP
jgi:hypothetical protein